MALFAMISGYLHYYFVDRYSLTDGFVRKVKTILIPCLAWGGIEYCYTIIRGWNRISILGCVQYLISHNWFLWAVFYCGLVVIILKRFVRNTGFFLGGVLIIVSSLFYPDFLNSIDFKMMFPAFLVGYYINNKKLVQRYLSRDSKTRLIILGATVFIYFMLMILIVDKKDIMYWQYYLGTDKLHDFGCLIKRIAINIVGSAMMILILMQLFNKLSNKCFIEKISLLGKDSLGIYMVQTIIFGYGLGALYIFSGLSEVLRGFTTIILSFIIIIFSILIVNLIKKNKILAKVLLGITK